MDKSDHVALTLIPPFAGVEEHLLPTSFGFTRKSFRRAWNQLPRCQRNLIVLVLTAFFALLMLLLPGDQLVNDINVKQMRKDISLLNRSKKDHYSPSRLQRDSVISGGSSHNSIERISSNLQADGAVAEELTNLEQPRLQKNNNKIIDKLKNFHTFSKPDIANHIASSSENLVAQKEVKIINEKVTLKSINSQEIINNNIEEPVSALESKANEETEAAATEDDDLSTHIKKLILNPMCIAGKNITEFLNSSNLHVPQKQHFHGANNARQTAVIAAFKHSWNGYKKYAWGYDNLKPVSQTSHDWFGLGLTLVDALDTMYIMGLEDEFNEARDWVKTKLSFQRSTDVNLFEVTIRVLGGLLAAYHLSGDKMFLAKSIELGNRLMPALQSSSGIPYSDVNIGDLTAHAPKWSPDSSTSEVTTIQLEFRDLSRSTNVSIYERAVSAVNDKVHQLEKKNGLVPIFINPHTGTFRNFATISLGARGDSYYEYLLKQWLQTGRKINDPLINDYTHSIDGILTKLMRRTPKEHYVYIGELINGKEFKPKMDHLTCYLPGVLLLGHHFGLPDTHRVLAHDLLDTCYQTYIRQPTHLAPEISYFALTDIEEHDIYVKPNDAHNLLRPEFIESLYYFYALTGDHKYQDMGWTIFEAFEKHTKVASGYTSISNVKSASNSRSRDMMESFWLSETLKYFYLLFSDNRKEIDLEKWVFNSEGHPLPIRQN